MINEFLDAIGGRIHDWFSGFLDLAYIGGWYSLGLVILLGVLALTWFFGALPVIGGWIRAIGGLLVLLAGAFLAGMTVMFNHNRKKKPVPKPPAEPERKPWVNPFSW